MAAPSNIGYAQTATCSNGAIIEVDGGYTLDWETICEAANPWQEKGIQVVVYLTHFHPETENDWYDHLDAVEVDLGLISADKTVDNFTPNVLAIEASTNATDNFGTNITFGRSLYDTPLDSDTAVNRIKATILDELRSENYTSAIVTALQQSYTLNYPAPTFADHLVQLAIWGLGLLVLLSIFNHFFGKKLKRRWRQYQQEQQLEEQVSHAHAILTHLFALLNGFIAADSPEESLLYRIYFTQGAEKYNQLLDTAVTHLKQTQGNLHQLTIQYQNLPQTEAVPLTEQLIQLETIYAQLIGTLANDKILSDETIRRELQPFFAANSVPHESELDSLQIEAKKPLTFVLHQLKIESAQLGIMDDVIAVKTELVRLLNAKKEAKPAIKTVQQRMAQIKSGLSPTLNIAPNELFTPINTILDQTDGLLANGRYLDIAPTLAYTTIGLNLIQELNTVWQAHHQRQQEIVDAGADGFHPPILMTLENKLTFTVTPLLLWFSLTDVKKRKTK